MSRESLTIVLMRREDQWFLGPAGTSGLLFKTRHAALDAARAWMGKGWRRQVLVEQADGSMQPLGPD